MFHRRIESRDFGIGDIRVVVVCGRVFDQVTRGILAHLFIVQTRVKHRCDRICVQLTTGSTQQIQKVGLGKTRNKFISGVVVVNTIRKEHPARIGT